MRRLIYKFYVKSSKILDKLLSLLIIHSSKFALLAMFIVSVSTPNVFNMLLFLTFLAFSVLSYAKVQKFWVVPIFINSLILVAINANDVFEIEAKLKIDSSVFKVIGISVEDSDDIIDRYGIYFGLLIVLILTQKILNT